jgi:hypothetical protein
MSVRKLPRAEENHTKDSGTKHDTLGVGPSSIVILEKLRTHGHSGRILREVFPQG